jgi:TRAP-type uncharacterized transport system fused permease subunit
MSDSTPDPAVEAARAAGLSEQDIVRTEIEQTRADLAETVDALHHKLDVKAQLKTRINAVSPQARIAAGAAAVLVTVLVVLKRRLSS